MNISFDFPLDDTDFEYRFRQDPESIMEQRSETSSNQTISNEKQSQNTSNQTVPPESSDSSDSSISSCSSELSTMPSVSTIIKSRKQSIDYAQQLNNLNESISGNVLRQKLKKSSFVLDKIKTNGLCFICVKVLGNEDLVMCRGGFGRDYKLLLSSRKKGKQFSGHYESHTSHLACFLEACSTEAGEFQKLNRDQKIKKKYHEHFQLLNDEGLSLENKMMKYMFDLRHDLCPLCLDFYGNPIKQNFIYVRKIAM